MPKTKQRRAERIARAKEVLGDENRLLTVDEILAITTLTYPAVWKQMKNGKFPLARKIGGNRIGWLKSEVDEWARNLPQNKPGHRRAA